MSELPATWRLRALAACAVLPPLVSAVSFARIAAFVGRSPARPPVSAPGDEILDAYVSQVLRRLPPPWRHTCLRRGVVLFHLLRRAGRPVSLCIGVRRAAPGAALEAHAWLVRGGVPYLEPERHDTATFQVIAAFPEPTPG